MQYKLVTNGKFKFIYLCTKLKILYFILVAIRFKVFFIIHKQRDLPEENRY